MTVPLELTAEQRADLERRCDEWLAQPAPADLTYFAEQCRHAGPERNLWLAGEWLDDRLRELGASDEIIRSVCTANGQRSFPSQDPWAVAQASLDRFAAGQIDVPGRKLANQLVSESPAMMQAVHADITISPADLLDHLRQQAQWIEALLADGKSRTWEPHLMIWRRPGFGQPEQMTVLEDFGNFNTDEEKRNQLVARGQKLAYLGGCLTCVALSSEAWCSRDPQFGGGPDGQQPKDDPHRDEAIVLFGMAVGSRTYGQTLALLKRNPHTGRIYPVKFQEPELVDTESNKLLDYVLRGYLDGMQQKLRQREQEMLHDDA